jgi:hypothetical protein
MTPRRRDDQHKMVLERMRRLDFNRAAIAAIDNSQLAKPITLTFADYF